MQLLISNLFRAEHAMLVQRVVRRLGLNQEGRSEVATRDERWPATIKRFQELRHLNGERVVGTQQHK